MSLELESRFVKRGYWINLSQGPIMGQTITTDSNTGAIVIALLAVTTSLGMTHLWHLLTFAYHQIRANGRPSNGFSRHQQVLLRTLPTPSALMADSLKLWLAWRRVSEHTLARSLLYTSTALIFALGSLAVSTLSSYVVSSSNLEVLVQSPYCGMLNWTANNWENYKAVSEEASESYASSCYRNGSLPSQCNVFIRPNIPFTTKEVDCPFKEKICASSAISLDSGLLDLNNAFGTNFEDPDRIQYRRKSTCAVLSLDGYTMVRNGSIHEVLYDRPVFPGEEFVHYQYGVRRNSGYPHIQSLLTANTSRDYMSIHAQVFQQDGSTDYLLIPALQKKDADVSLRLIAKNSVRYGVPVNDPMFSAHYPTTLATASGNATFYLSDFPGSVMGCVQQYQYCVNEEACSELAGISVQMDDIRKIFPSASEVQLVTIEVLRNAAYIHDLVSSEWLESRQLKLSTGLVLSLPDDQWIREVKSWESIVWAAHQVTLIDYAIGPVVRDPLSETYVSPPANEGQRKLCGMQKMRKPGGFVNINYFGLIFIISVSGTIILIDLVLLRFLIHLRKYKLKLVPRIDRWLQDGIYQLERRAHEAQGNGIWKKLEEEVPITQDNCLLPDLPIDTLPISKTPAQASLVQGLSGASIAGPPPQTPAGRLSAESSPATVEENPATNSRPPTPDEGIGAASAPGTTGGISGTNARPQTTGESSSAGSSNPTVQNTTRAQQPQAGSPGVDSLHEPGAEAEQTP